MAWFAAIPIAMQAMQQQNAANYNAAVAGNEAKSTMQMTGVAEGNERRAAREVIGRESAAVGQSGTGYGGSPGSLLDQSAVNAELDALNTRYRGSLTAYGFKTQQSIDTQAGKDAMTAGVARAGGVGLSSYLQSNRRAGAALLTGYSSYGGTGAGSGILGQSGGQLNA